jgi:tagatose 1,6-diphosphate aldolase
MEPLTPIRARRIDRLTGGDGLIIGVATDHRDSLNAALRARGLHDWTLDQISRFKQLVARVLGPAATLMLLDVETSAAQAIATGALPGTTALALPMEAQAYEALDGGPKTTLLEDWHAARSAALGADACKLLLPFRCDRPDHADVQEAVAALAVREAHTAGLPLILEPIVFANGDEPLPADEFERLVVMGAGRLAKTGADILKVQYPGSREGCRAISVACAGTPWVLLGGGADAEVLERQVGDAAASGASGFIVGRTLFNDALIEDPVDSERVLTERSLPLLDRLATAMRKAGTPWRTQCVPVRVPELGWHRVAPRDPIAAGSSS